MWLQEKLFSFEGNNTFNNGSRYQSPTTHEATGTHAHLWPTFLPWVAQRKNIKDQIEYTLHG